MKISPHIEAVQYPPITEVKSWLSEIAAVPGRPLLDLCQAVPDYAPAPELVAYLKEQLDDPMTSRYSPDEGLAEAREAVCDWTARRYGTGPKAGEVCLTIGASQAFWLAITVLCRAGDEVIVQLPAYFDHPMALEALGIRPVWVPFNPETGGQPDIDAIASRVSARTRAILVVSPSNPTGAVSTPETIRQLFELARKHDIALVLDETYNAFLPPGIAPHHLFDDPHWQGNFIQVASFGKTFALTGYRAGALVAGEELIHHALKVQDTMAVCQPRITQAAVRYGCEHLDDWVADNAIMMQQRHDRFRDLFTQPGNRFELLASGGFFAWVKHPWPELTSKQACRRLLAEGQVITLPGDAFGPGLQDCLRLAFGNIKAEVIPDAVERLTAF